MPLYEYRCTSCAHHFERLVRSTSAADEADCPSCGSNATQRLPSSFAARVGATAGASYGSGCAPAVGGGGG